MNRALSSCELSPPPRPSRQTPEDSEGLASRGPRAGVAAKASGRLTCWGLVPLLIAIGCRAGGAQGPPAPALDPLIEPGPGVALARTCSPTGLERCFDARDDNCNGLIDEGCGLPTGLVQFVVAWSEPSADIDLFVADPNGEFSEVGRTTASGLVKERDCPGRDQDCLGQNVENVYLEQGEPLRGRYEVRVRLESLGDASPPVRVTLGARVGPKTYSAELGLTRPGEERRLSFEL